MDRIGKISAVFFDMDGTLVDTELLSEPVVRSVCAEAGVDCPNFEWTGFYGVSWRRIAEQIAASVSGLPDIGEVSRRLHETYEELCAADPPTPVPGAREAVVAAHAQVPTGIVSSSFRNSIDATIERLQLGAYVTCRAGADDYANSKPAPDGYLHAAELLDVDPENCLAFEDSLAGIQAAGTAGMKIIAITHRSNVATRALDIADGAIRNFTELDTDFFARIAVR